jgi:hypothetical protein
MNYVLFGNPYSVNLPVALTCCCLLFKEQLKCDILNLNKKLLKELDLPNIISYFILQSFKMKIV